MLFSTILCSCRTSFCFFINWDKTALKEWKERSRYVLLIWILIPELFISFPYFSGKIDSRSLVPWGNCNAHNNCQRHWHQPANWYRFNVQVWMKMLLSTSDVHSNIMILYVWSHSFWSVSGITFYNIAPSLDSFLLC